MAATRDRIIEATASLLQRRGYNASGLKQISSDSGAPFGSLYHFFPGGKEELAAATLRWSGDGYARLVGGMLDQEPDDLVAAMRLVFDRAAENLQATDYVDACPIATVALEVASTNDGLRQVTNEIFEGWLSALDARFVDAGVDADRARDLSTLFLAALEGGFLLSRAARDPAPMRALGRSVAEIVALELSKAGSQP